MQCTKVAGTEKNPMYVLIITDEERLDLIGCCDYAEQEQLETVELARTKKMNVKLQAVE